MARQTRRAVLAALLSGIAATAGCGAFGQERVDVLVAGSLQKAASGRSRPRLTGNRRRISLDKPSAWSLTRSATRLVSRWRTGP